MLHEPQFDMKWWHQYFLWVHQWLQLDIVLPHRELCLLRPVLPLVLCFSVPAVPNAKITGEIDKIVLETHQECHHFEVSDDSAILIILQGFQQGLYAVVIFEVHQVSQGKKMVLVPITKQHGFEAPWCDVKRHQLKHLTPTKLVQVTDIKFTWNFLENL